MTISCKGLSTIIGGIWLSLLVSACGNSGTTGNEYSDAQTPQSDITAPQEAPAAPSRTGETYRQLPENMFLAVAERPRSTFSVDVDRASYAIVRSYLSQGQLPPPEAVRIEELVNYFDYAYPQPTDGRPLAVHSEVSTCPWNPNHQLVLLGLQAHDVNVSEMPRANLVFLVDVSGSMTEELPLVKQSLKLLVSRLRNDDRVSIVTYAGGTDVVLRGTWAKFKDKINDGIDALAAGGGTNGAGGIDLAYDLAEDNLWRGGNNRVILVTDGDFNLGPASPEGLQGLIEEKAKTGVFLSVLGVGHGNLNDQTMELLSDKGNGNYAYLDNLMEAEKVLVQEMSGTLLTVAKDVKLQVEFNPRYVASYRLIGYENRALADRDFKDDKKDAGEIGAGHRVTALYEIVPAGAAAADPNAADPLRYQKTSVGGPVNELLTLKLRYKEPKGEASNEYTVAVPAEVQPLQQTPNLRLAAAVASAGMLLRGSQYAGKANFALVNRLAGNSPLPDPTGSRGEFVRLMNVAASLPKPKVTAGTE